MVSKENTHSLEEIIEFLSMIGKSEGGQKVQTQR